MKKIMGNPFHGISLLILLPFVGFVTATKVTSSLSRKDFPDGFVFGTASAAYQYEGAAKEGGRGPSIWDTFTHKYPEKIADGSNGDVAVDSYHRYKEDVKIMKGMGLDAYRLSISWSRILPNGKISGGVNKEGIRYYKNLINELLANDIQPYVTIFHWDLPQVFDDEYGGFLSSQIVDDFENYADLCFKEFGDKVKHWITLNEPYIFSLGGYALGSLAPGRCSKWQNLNCTGGNSATEPYLVAHHLLLAHAAAVKLYRQKYQAKQKGIIGITLVSHWFVPFSNATHDKDAALRALDFMLGWFMNPIISGNYPHSMQSLVGNRLPKFSKNQSDLVKGSFDFVGLNYYTGKYAADVPRSNVVEKPSFSTDARTNVTSDRNGIPIGQPTAANDFHVYPTGIHDLLVYIKKNYNNPLIYITENGMGELNNATLPLKEALKDNMRVRFYHDHISSLHLAIKDGVNVRGYFAWSLLDNFEWSSGFTIRFGVNFVDYKNGLKRYPKLSASWFRNFLKH